MLVKEGGQAFLGNWIVNLVAYVYPRHQNVYELHLMILQDADFNNRGLDDCLEAMGTCRGCRVADWFAQLNNKMGGDLKKIQVVGEYMIEIWKAVGMERIGDKVRLACFSVFHGAQLFRITNGKWLVCSHFVRERMP